MDSVNAEFGMTLETTSESESYFCRTAVEPNFNYVRHGRTSELGLRVFKENVFFIPYSNLEVVLFMIIVDYC